MDGMPEWKIKNLQKALAKKCRLFVSVSAIQIGEAVWL